MKEQRLTEAMGMQQARRMRAADWLQRVNSDTVTDRELKEWLEWYSQSEGNRRAFDQAEVFFRSLRAAPPAAKNALRQLAAAKGESALGAGWPRSKRTPWSLAAVVVLAVLGAFAGSRWQADVQQPTERYRTALGEHRQVELPDGSIAIVGAQSTLDVQFDRESRSLQVISGEAYFKVKHDPLRPFVVRAGHAEVTAIGTAFNVRNSGDRVTVAVVQGAVRVERTGWVSSLLSDPRRVSAGERAVLVESAPMREKSEPQVTPADPAAVVAWQHRQLSFSGEPLSSVVESINRYSTQKVEIGDPRIGEMSFTGTVLPDRVEEWAMHLPLAFPLQAVRHDGHTLRLLPVTGNSQ